MECVSWYQHLDFENFDRVMGVNDCMVLSKNYDTEHCNTCITSILPNSDINPRDSAYGHPLQGAGNLWV